MFVTCLTLQEMLPNRSQSDINREHSLYFNHIDAQHVTERSFYTEIITGHVNSLGAVWRHFYIYPHVVSLIHMVCGGLLVN